MMITILFCEDNMRFVVIVLFAINTACAYASSPITYSVVPSGETRFGYEAGDADDPCIWVHPTRPELSTIIGTDKDYGVSVFDLAGNEIQHLQDGRLNNVDIRYGFPLGDETVDIVTAGNRSNDTIMIYAVDPENRKLRNIAEGEIRTKIVVYGSCMYRSHLTGKYYVFINSQEGEVEQWELFDNGNAKVDAKLVRTFAVGSQTEGCVTDDEYGTLYIGEEEHAIWKYKAEPDAGNERGLVDEAGEHFTIDVEGLAIYYGPNGTGYLIASSQGDSTYVVYERGGENAFVMKFQIGEGSGIDAVSDTDGLDVINVNLGERYPKGLFVAHDGPDKTFKLVRWDDIAKQVDPPLMIETGWHPRNMLK